MQELHPDLSAIPIRRDHLVSTVTRRHSAALVVAIAASFGGVAALASVWPVSAGPAAGAGLAADASGISRVEAERAEMRGQLCSSANAVGVGLRGQYFARAGFQGEPVLTRVDPTLDLSLSLSPSSSSGGADALRAQPASVRWTGWVKAPMSGRYRFHAQPAGVVIEVANQRWTGDGAGTDAAVELAGGRFYPITVEWARVDPAAGALRLQWTAPHGARFTIPRNSLFLPTDQAQAQAGRG